MSDIAINTIADEFYPNRPKFSHRSRQRQSLNFPEIEIGSFELSPFCLPQRQSWRDYWHNDFRVIRYCLDDHNHLVKLARGDRRFKQFAHRKIHLPEFFAMLRYLAPRLGEVHDYGTGLGYLSQILATMRSFNGTAHIFALEKASADAAQLIAEQLGSFRRLRIHSHVENGERDRTVPRPRSKVSLFSLPLPDLVHLDLSCDPLYLPTEVNQIIARARPLILMHLPPQPLRQDRVLTWLYGNDYRLYSLGLRKNRARNFFDLRMLRLDLGGILDGLNRGQRGLTSGLLAVPSGSREHWFDGND